MAGIFKAYDIRGLYPGELDSALAKRIGHAFARLLDCGRIVIGRDARLSSPVLGQAFIEGYTAGGGAVADIGMVSTPLLYHAIADGDFAGGAMVTASHLPAEMNGFKLCRAGAVPLSGDAGLPELERMTNSPAPAEPAMSRTGVHIKTRMTNPYITKLAGFARAERRLKIAVDAGDGMAGPEASLLFRHCPLWELVPLNMEPDGQFPHHGPNPFINDATAELERRVPAERADFGVAFDGDADRCLFVDEQGSRVPADLVTALIARSFLADAPGALVLYDLRSSRVVAETIRSFGGVGKRCRVGHAFIKEQMREENALFAGELSGHYYFRSLGYIDCGLMAMIAIANLVSAGDAPLSSLVHPLLKYRSSGELNLQVSRSSAVIESLAAAYRTERIDRLDGLTVDSGRWWFNLRPSNTEPVIRLNIEADSQALVDEKKDEVLKVIRDADPSARLIAA